MASHEYFIGHFNKWVRKEGVLNKILCNWTYVMGMKLNYKDRLEFLKKITDVLEIIQ